MLWWKINTKINLPEGIRYRAFLSYRTSDKKQAEWLHKIIENYRVPSQLIGKEGRFGKISDRVGPIFRDRDDARCAHDIETLIAEELSRSLHLIVLCTPRTRERDAWVGREIEIFRTQRPGAEIHAIVGDGSPPDCFPDQLLVWDKEGKLHLPLASDLRSQNIGGDGKQKAVIKLIAALIGTSFDDLWQRERKRLLRNRIILAVIIFAMAIIVIGIIDFVRSNRDVDRMMQLSSAAVTAKRWDIAAAAAAAAAGIQSIHLPLFVDRSEAVKRLNWLRGAGRTKTLMMGHKKSISDVLLLNDSNIITASLDSTVRLWNGTNFTELSNGIGEVKRLALSQNGRLLAIASDRSITLLDLHTGQVLLDWISPQGDGFIKALSFARGNDLLLIAASNGKLVGLWGPDYHRSVLMFDNKASIESLAISPSGHRIAIGDVYGNLRVFDIVAEKLLSIQGYDYKNINSAKSINHIVFGRNDDTLLSSSKDNAVITKLFTTNSTVIFTIRDLSVEYSEFASPPSIVLSILYPSSIAIWSTETGNLIRELIVDGCKFDEPFNRTCKVTQAHFIRSINGQPHNIIAGYEDGSIRLWSSDGKLIGELPGHVGRITKIILSQDGNILVSSSEDGTSRFWKFSVLSPTEKTYLLAKFCEDTDPYLKYFDSNNRMDYHNNLKDQTDLKQLYYLLQESQALNPCYN